MEATQYYFEASNQPFFRVGNNYYVSLYAIQSDCSMIAKESTNQETRALFAQYANRRTFTQEELLEITTMRKIAERNAKALEAQVMREELPISPPSGKYYKF